jgi:CheY-like chemotaxis protein
MNMKNNLEVLIVEDEIFIAKALELELNKRGYAVSAILSQGEDVLNWLGEHIPDLILMDIQLAGKIDGIETIEAMSKDIKIPVVFMSATNTDEIKRKILKLNPVGFVDKPIDYQQLNMLIQKSLS